MTAVDRAAEVIRGAGYHWAGEIAEALSDAGLLVTDEMQAVLDACESYRDEQHHDKLSSA